MLCDRQNAPDTRTAPPFSHPGFIADLVPIIVSWPSVPDPIKTAVKAVLAPYLIAEGWE